MKSVNSFNVLLNTIKLLFNKFRLLSKGGKRALYILTDVEKYKIKASYIQQLTDLKVLLCDTCSSTEFTEKFEISYVRNIILSIIYYFSFVAFYYL